MANKNKTLTNEKKVELLKPKIDVVFERLFTKDNKKITKAFVEALLEKEVTEIVINEDKELLGQRKIDKTGILDLELDIDSKEKVDVEIQLTDKKNIAERILFYFSRLYIKEIKKGMDYKEAKRVVIIAILDYELELTKFMKELETVWELREKNHTELILTDKLEIRIISLKKVKEIYNKDKNNEKAQWLLFLDDPNCREVKDIMKKNEEIKEAVVKVREMSEDETMQKRAFRRMVEEMDKKAIMDYGLEKRKTRTD